MLLFVVLSNSVCADAFKGKYIDNYDGDTFKVDIAKLPDVFGKGIPVRIRGIDAPEMTDFGRCGQRLARIGKCVLKSILIKAKKIELRNVDRDKYFRLLADVYVGQVNIADKLFEYDLVVPYDGQTKGAVDWCKLIGKALTHEAVIVCR
jgi:endonuclease YncB( thermonuclease family)